MRKILCFLLFCVVSLPVMGAALINDTETERLLYEMVEPLAAAADIPSGRLKIHIIDDNDFNAFVRGGEDVYVYTGLLKQIKSPSALQAVIAHEMGHMLGGHTAQMADRIAAEIKRTMLIQALGVGLMVAGGNPSLGAGVMAGASGVATQSMMAFTRDEERIADNMGVDLMVRAGQDVNGFITVLEQMNDMMGVMESKINPNRINHPLTTERLNNVSARIAKHDIHTQNNDEYNARYELVRAKLVGYLDTPQRVLDLYPYSDKSDAGLYARAIANMRSGNLDGARMGAQTLVYRHPKNPYFYELLGDIEYQFGHYDDSIDLYNRSVELSDNAPQIQTALALVLSQRGRDKDITRAIELCKHSLLQSPLPLTYWVLARAYGDTDVGRSNWAMAEYYYMNGKKEQAKQYAMRAQKKLKKTDSEYIKSGELIK